MATNYTSYFDKIPKIKYDINRSLVNPRYETVTNIFFRIRYIQEVLNNLSSYFTAELEDGETPEIIAEKVYGDAGAHWMITIANQIIDPQWEWPLDYDEFNKYLIGKYGSIENSQTTIHHYEMIVTSTLSPDNIVNERKYIVNGEKLTDNNMTVPYNYFTPAMGEDTPGEFGLQPGSLALTQSVTNYNINGKTIKEVVRGQEVSNYDYESGLNEQRRLIKIVKKEYYQQILKEFNDLALFAPAFRRRVI